MRGPQPACPPADAARQDLVAAGELLAVNETQVHVLTADGIAAVPWPCIAHASLGAHRTLVNEYALWTTLGVLSTPSHGGFLLFSFPGLVLGGSLATSSESRNGVVRYPNQPWPVFRPYARFPQGLPDGYTPSPTP
jgi:hypothetical protein